MMDREMRSSAYGRQETGSFRTKAQRKLPSCRVVAAANPNAAVAQKVPFSRKKKIGPISWSFDCE
jgi:hypothetical protein